jgi:predicted outer membrane repeat protein
MQLLSWLHKRMTGRPQSRRTSANRPAPRYRPRLEPLEGRDLPSTLTVMNTADDGSAGSLRAEIAAAQPGDTITFAPGLDGQTITLTGGELDITKSLTIQGPSDGQLTISGNHASRVFEVDGSTTNVTLSGLTITQGDGLGGTLSGPGGGILNNGSTLTVTGCTLSDNSVGNMGGGIYNLSGTLTVSGCTLSGNTAIYGGGISNAVGNPGGPASTTISNSTLSGNVASSGGGGIDNHNTGTVTVNSCTLSGNTSQGVGGGIANWGTLSVTGSTLSGNSALAPDGGDSSNLGGGVYNQEGTVTLTGCTLSNNTAGYEGGAVYTLGTVTVTVTGKKPHTVVTTVVTGAMTISGCTVTGNSAELGGGFYNAGSSAMTLTIANSAFSVNSCIYGTSSLYGAYIYDGPSTDGGGNTFTFA